MADDKITLEGEGEQTPPERPEWLPPQFKTPEDLARSYDEIRRETDRLRSRQEQSEREFAEALATVQQEQEQRQQRIDPNTDPRIQAYQRAVDEGDAATQLAITLDLNRQLIQAELASSTAQVTPQITAMQEAQRQQQIDVAEQQAVDYARTQGLDYEASRQDVVDALRSLYGDQLLPASGDVPTYATAIRNAVDIVTAKAQIEYIKSGEQERRDKLSAMTTTPGASGRLATGSPDERQAWAEVKNAPTGSYADMMSRSERT